MAPKRIVFWITIDGVAFLGPKVGRDQQIAELFQLLPRHTSTPQGALTNVDPRTCLFYKFRTPVSCRDFEDLAELEDACLAVPKEDRLKIALIKSVKDLAKDQYLTSKFACLVIQTPRYQLTQAIRNLQQDYDELFQCLQITLDNIRGFSRADVVHNMRGPNFWGSGVPRTVGAIVDLEDGLVAIRTYEPSHSDRETSRDLAIANHYPEHFDQYFEVLDSSAPPNPPPHVAAPDVNNPREFITFFSLFRCHAEDAVAIAADSVSSHMKSNHFAYHFLMPPFFVCPPPGSRTTFKAESPWKFPIFLATTSEPSTWCKFAPVSDFSAWIDEFSFPLLVCEVISIKNESDRWRMLLQGIALARVLYALRKPHASISFFVVAIYLRSDLTAERFIVMQTGPNREVSIAQKDYHLKNSDDSWDFLKELYNLQIKFDAMSNELDDEKKGALAAIKECAGPIPSLSRRRDDVKEGKVASRATLSSVQEDDDDSDFTQASDVQEYLAQMGYISDALVARHSNVAMISPISDPLTRGFLKFTQTPSEVDILKRLSSIKAPDNHTIPDFNCWERRSGGFVFFTSSGGGHLTDLREPDVHVWSVAKQLAEGVAFMHRNNVAHLDIKPANLHIPVQGGRLSINDFSLAVLVDRPGKKLRGEVGTKGYIAPEVWAGERYDPFRADLWSCGQTLQELLSCCTRLTRETGFLGRIASELMASEPWARPMMSDVLAQMTTFESLSLGLPQPEIGFHSSSIVATAAAA